MIEGIEYYKCVECGLRLSKVPFYYRRPEHYHLHDQGLCNGSTYSWHWEKKHLSLSHGKAELANPGSNPGGGIYE